MNPIRGTGRRLNPARGAFVHRRTILSLLAAGGALVLAACANLPGYLPTQTVASQHLPDFYTVYGRVAVRQNDKGYNARFRWIHQGEVDQVFLLTPLGTIAAKLETSREGAYFLDQNGRRTEADDAEQLSRKLLGWRLPVRSLRYWLLGLAAEGSAMTWSTVAQQPRLQQQGWQVDYTDPPGFLPGQHQPNGITLTYQPDTAQSLHVKLILSDWSFTPEETGSE